MPLIYAQVVVFTPDGRVLLVKPAHDKKWHATLDTYVGPDIKPKFEILNALKYDLNIMPDRFDTDIKYELTLTVNVDSGKERILSIFSIHLKKNIILISNKTFPLKFAAIAFSKLTALIVDEEDRLKTNLIKRSFDINSHQTILAIDGTLRKTITKGCYIK